MPPPVGHEMVSGMAHLDAAIAIVGVVVVGLSLMVVWVVCGGGEKKKEEAPGEEQNVGKEGEKSTGKGAEPSAKTAAGGGEAAAAAAPKSDKGKGLEPPPGSKLKDATEARKGGGPELKRAGVPTAGAVSEDNPAYQTLMNESAFKASQKPGGKGAPGAKGAEQDKVAATNPAYQTIMNDSKFEASKKPKSPVKGTASMAATATAMAGPTDKQTMVKTAMAGGTTKK